MQTPPESPSPLFDTFQHEAQSSLKTAYPYPTDYQQAAEFINSYRGSEATFNAYRREIERLLQWSAHMARKPLTDIKKQDIEAFVYFCQQPPPQWIGLKKCDRYVTQAGLRKPNPDWRPFVVTLSKTSRALGRLPIIKDYRLSQKALQAIFAILGSFFNFLIQQDYMSHNPVSQIRQKSKYFRSMTNTPIRRLSELQWSYVIETAEMIAKQHPIHERTLFIMNALYGMYLRISELATSKRWQPQMGHFFRDSDGHWWFKTVGKGNKERQIAVSDAMLNALKRYRQHLNLPLLPTLGETTPLLSKNKGKGPITSTRQIRDIVQNCFDAAILRMQADGFLEEAEQLKAATVHWLRHTGISEDVKSRPREHVRDDAGHGSSATTDHYIDVELRERHASSKNKRIKPEA
jgi:site-specific recombinase XerD